MTITYSYSNLLDGNLPGGLEPAEIQQAIEEALNLWASFAPLKFVYMEDSGPMPDDDDTSYSPTDHPDIRFGHHAIDGESGVLAHAYYPFGTGLSGDVHFDNGDAWSIGPDGNSFDLIEVAVHEIGHSLGIHHEPEPPAGNDAIMNPFYGERYNGFGTSFLLDDDVAAVQNLYGEVQSLLGVWTVTIVNPGEFVEDIDFGSFLNDDFGSDPETSEPVDSPSFIQGNIESYGDIDWFSFEAEVGQSFSFETLLEDGDIEDTIIRLLDQDGNVLLGTDDDGGVKLASKLPWIAPAAGTYYIEVSGYNANVGTYTLRIAAAPPGDLDVDGFVGVNDLQIILAHWNQNVPVGNVLMGDPSFDGFVGIDDLNLVLGNWNAGNQNAAATQQAASAQEETATVSQASASTEAQQADQQAQTQTAQAVVATGQQTQRAQTAQRQRVRQADRPSKQVDQTRNAIAAWSRQPVQQAASTPFVSPVNMTDSDESEGLLGLWSRDEDA